MTTNRISFSVFQSNSARLRVWKMMVSLKYYYYTIIKKEEMWAWKIDFILSIYMAALQSWAKGSHFSCLSLLNCEMITAALQSGKSDDTTVPSVFHAQDVKKLITLLWHHLFYWLCTHCSVLANIRFCPLRGDYQHSNLYIYVIFLQRMMLCVLWYLSK